MSNVQGGLAAVGAILTLVAVVAGAWAVARTTALKATLETVIIGNEELRKTNDDLRASAHELAVEYDKQRAHDRAEYRAEIARLEGQLQMLTGHLGERIAASVVAALPLHLSTTRDTDSRTRSTD